MNICIYDYVCYNQVLSILIIKNMREGGFWDKALETLTGERHPNAEKRDRVYKELLALQQSLRAHEGNLGLVSEGLERSPGKDYGGVRGNLIESIRQKEVELEKLPH